MIGPLGSQTVSDAGVNRSYHFQTWMRLVGYKDSNGNLTKKYLSLDLDQIDALGDEFDSWYSGRTPASRRDHERNKKAGLPYFDFAAHKWMQNGGVLSSIFADPQFADYIFIPQGDNNGRTS